MLYEIVIIGAGISGLTTALSLHKQGVEHVLIVDYQPERGGFASPFLQSNAFARERTIVEQSAVLPYEIWQKATVVGFFAGESGQPHQLYIQTTGGTKTVSAKRLVIASGALEKPREGHKIGGTRPAGVMTPTMAVNLLVRGYKPGEHIVVLETGRMSEAACQLLASQGCDIERFSATEWELTHVFGRARVQEVHLKSRKNGQLLQKRCDTLIFGQGRIPSSFFLKGTPVARDEHYAILIDDKGQTNLAGVYATGSCTSLGDDDHLNSIDLAREMAQALLNSL